MNWLLELASSVRSKFYDELVELAVRQGMAQLAAQDTSLTIVSDTILNQSVPLLILSADPRATFLALVNWIKETVSEDARDKFNPITIITKLANREFIFDVNGASVAYGISSKHTNLSLIRSMSCRTLYSVKNYFSQVGHAGVLPDTVLSEISPIQSIDGGRSKQKNKPPVVKAKVNIKLALLGQLVEYIRTNSLFMNALVYLNTLHDVDHHALDLVYSDMRARSAVIDQLKLLVEQSYPAYKFEINSHQGYSVPFDFRLRKLSCSIKHKASGQVHYLVNLYNAGTYDPIPSYRSTSSRADTCQFIAHPLVRMRFLYLDLFFLQSKSIGAKAHNHFETILTRMLSQAFSDLQTPIEDELVWVGLYRDEAYDRNRENMRSNIAMPYESIFI